jgi:hypothetical protein
MAKAAAAPVTVMCDEFPEEVAVAHYRWDWGAEGNCCAKSQQLLQQKSGVLKRPIHFSPLAVEAPPIGRDERTQLMAAKLSAEAERNETSERAQKTYAANQELRKELAGASTQIKHLETQLVVSADAVKKAEGRSKELSEKLGEANKELERIRPLVQDVAKGK